MLNRLHQGYLCIHSPQLSAYTTPQLCRECFFTAFENEIHETILEHQLFSPGERVAIGASGGKDSTVLAHILTTLNAKHGYGDTH